MKQAQFDKERAMVKVAKPNEDFDKDWEFISTVVFNENHEDKHHEFKGHLWVREMFMLAQAHSPSITPLVVPFAIIMSTSFVITDRLWNKYFDPVDDLDID